MSKKKIIIHLDNKENEEYCNDYKECEEYSHRLNYNVPQCRKEIYAEHVCKESYKHRRPDISRHSYRKGKNNSHEEICAEGCDTEITDCKGKSAHYNGGKATVFEVCSVDYSSECKLLNNRRENAEGKKNVQNVSFG